jgi:hypothetical protein
MLHDPAKQIIGHTGIKDRTMSINQDINKIFFGPHDSNIPPLKHLFRANVPRNNIVIVKQMIPRDILSLRRSSPCGREAFARRLRSILEGSNLALWVMAVICLSKSPPSPTPAI